MLSLYMYFQKTEVQDALTKSEISKAELEVELNRIRIEHLTLRDNLIKLQQLNEQLIHEKGELQKVIDTHELGIVALCMSIKIRKYFFSPFQRIF